MIDRVKKQYNEYPYPEPIDDLESQIEKGYKEQSDLKISWPILFPEKKYQDDINRIQGSEAARILADVQTSLLSSNIQKR